MQSQSFSLNLMNQKLFHFFQCGLQVCNRKYVVMIDNFATWKKLFLQYQTENVYLNNSQFHFEFLLFQYKGAHVKPGFAEHFYSNPARYKGRENMLVCYVWFLIFTRFKIIVFQFCIDFLLLLLSIMIQSKMRLVGCKKLILMVLSSFILESIPTNGYILNRQSP